jgi:DNA-binding NarL/FixJ family response regulator
VTIRIALADDHRVFRESLRVVLTQEPDLEIVGEAGTGQDILALVAAQQPELLLLDIALPDASGIDLARQLTQVYPRLAILALTGYADRIFIKEMLKAGARGYVVKSAGSGELLQGIRALATGQSYFCAEATRALAGEPTGTDRPASPPVAVLTKRERQVLKALAEGQRSSQIAEQLGISPATVVVYRRKLKARLGLHTTAELTRYALREGLV